MNTYIILLNWNGWQDTIECLESLFRLDGQDFRVLVCDNDSADESLQKIKSWACGAVYATTANVNLRGFTSPPVPKPIPLREIAAPEVHRVVPSNAKLTLVQTGSNLGFAGGNNVGIRIALQDPMCDSIWLLNPDTVVAPGALSALRRKVKHNARIGICGSLNRAYYAPDEIQAHGGKSYNFWTGRVRKQSRTNSGELSSSTTGFDYINGASMFVTRHFIETVGLMEESYFLYFEELDWAMRSRGKFELGYAADSVIYHKEGSQLGSSPDRLARSLLADKCLSRNRILFARRFAPWTLPSVMFCVGLAAMERLSRGDAKRAAAMLASLVEGLTYPK